MNVYIYVYVCIYTYICIYAYVHTHMCVFFLLHIYIYIYIYMYIYIALCLSGKHSRSSPPPLAPMKSRTRTTSSVTSQSYFIQLLYKATSQFKTVLRLHRAHAFPTLETTQGQIDGLFSQLSFNCYLDWYIHVQTRRDRYIAKYKLDATGTTPAF